MTDFELKPYTIDGIFLMIFFAFFLSILLITISYLLSLRKWDGQKLSPYECGFEPFGDARQKFDIRYFRVSLIFIVFDLEVSYLFPLIGVEPLILADSGYLFACIFVIVLAVGLIYEYSMGVLEEERGSSE